ncbi:large conductance mechanosensitive channel protein MscL [Actinocrinis puniceicyclus]|uniref:Large conductance mechanosensitive channel protein MscL n=1 Tax=Actinocrinis puniceicyclus TaxID=977794 RepID=A0A8J7WMF2_9ACTN|nr:large conductance mechanosensitive channel protein MscL [Actinocrinis puniceicyclus]MBS2963993.1 large conductance mechanosensitive channel protein MscL [Actinocrinis puniceicyclus]
MNGFFKFVIRGNVVGLAVGVVIGAAFSTVVSAFVSAFLTPLVDWATSNVGDYSKMAFHLGKSTFGYGSFINAVIAFTLTAAAIYFLVVLPVNKISEELNPHHDLARAKRACPECLTQIPAIARRCSACTAVVEPILDEYSDKLIEAAPGQIELTGSAALSLKGAAKAE